MKQIFALGCLLAIGPSSAVGQEPARIQLLRCVTPGEAICTELRIPADPGRTISGRFARTTLQDVSTTTEALRSPRVFAIAVASLSQLGRLPSSGWVAWRGRADSSYQRMVWSPPLIAMPNFQGTVGRQEIRADIGEALGSGTVGGGNRPAVAVIAALVLLAMWVVVPRGWGGEPLNALPPDDSSTRGGTSAGPAAPRGPEDITRQTARRTALRR
ncbi:MAG TPA: hypothetical protein VGM77_08540 [Gemmatimonadales bacterium]|jgi:hypothetical protein